MNNRLLPAHRLSPALLGAILICLPVAGWPVSADRQKPEVSTVHQEETGPGPAGPGTTQMLERAVGYLLAQQTESGLWHSRHYGNLKQGAGVTALVLYALSRPGIDLDRQQQASLQRAIEALQPGIEQYGFVANPDGPDYSNYGSSMLLLAGRHDQLTLPEETRQRLVAYLVRSQLDEDEGFAPTSPDFGGWDLSGWMSGQRPTTGSNISVTRSVLEALQHFPEAPGVSTARDRARCWLQGCRDPQGEGGFSFHPRNDHDGNKAGWEGPERRIPRSYGSATADGILAALDAGYGPDSEPVRDGLGWLIRHPQVAVVPGFEDDANGRSWREGLKYYWYQALAGLLDQLPEDQARSRAGTVLAVLTEQQQTDGSWSNPEARMREDDPLIATAFAVIALSRILEWQTRNGTPDQ